LKGLFSSNLLTTEQKRAHLQEVQGDDKSDLAQNCKLTCEAYIPTAENKAAVWKEITDPNSTLSAKQRQAQMGGFFSASQLDLVRPYFDKYYEVLPDIESQHGYKYLQFFSNFMVPTLEIEDKHIVMLANIKSKVPDTNKVF
jgi:aminopeptidase N